MASRVFSKVAKRRGLRGISYHLFRIGCHQSVLWLPPMMPLLWTFDLSYRLCVMTRSKLRFKCVFLLLNYSVDWCKIVLIMIVMTVRHERSTRSSQWSTIRAFPTSDMLIFSVGYDCYDYSTWWWLGTLLLLRCQKRGRWWWWRWKRQEQHWKYYFWREQLKYALIISYLLWQVPLFTKMKKVYFL